MALFGKKHNQYDEASNKLNGKQAKDRIIFEQLEDDDTRACSLVDSLKSGSPLVINFEKLDQIAGNKMLAFLSGATYASDGRTLRINPTTYLFARRADFLDGSLQEFIKSIPTS